MRGTAKLASFFPSVQYFDIWLCFKLNQNGISECFEQSLVTNGLNMFLAGMMVKYKLGLVVYNDILQPWKRRKIIKTKKKNKTKIPQPEVNSKCLWQFVIMTYSL